MTDLVTVRESFKSTGWHYLKLLLFFTCYYLISRNKNNAGHNRTLHQLLSTFVALLSVNKSLKSLKFTSRLLIILYWRADKNVLNFCIFKSNTIKWFRTTPPKKKKDGTIKPHREEKLA